MRGKKKNMLKRDWMKTSRKYTREDVILFAGRGKKN